MASIVSYRKAHTAHTVIMLALPLLSGRQQGTELATLDGITYVSLPDGATLPKNQPTEIAESVQLITPDPALKAAIKDASPQASYIAEQMISKIRSAYTIDDEMYFARIGVGAATGMYKPTADEMQSIAAFGEFVEGVRQWGREQRAALGL